ncbi:17733_t:CDS:1, partial [Cetraspora pellucida]
LDKLKRLYKLISTTALLDYSEDMSNTSSTNKEDSYLKIEDVNENNNALL